MLSLSVTEFSRKLKDMLDLVEFRGEEIVLLRNKHKIARITPGSPHLTAVEAMSDLYRILPDEAGAEWAANGRMENRVAEMRDPWE